MPTKPTKKPEWASTDVVDATSGQNNVAEPSETKKDRGWDREEIPPRQWWNWILRTVYQWVDWLDGTTIPLSSDVGTSNEQLADGTGHTHALNGASQAEAEAGTNNTKVMTPLRVQQAISAQGIEFQGFSISGATLNEIGSFSFSAENTNGRGVSISPDGLMVFVGATDNNAIYQYDLSTPYDLSSASYSGVSLDVSSETLNMLDHQFSDDGALLFVNDNSAETLFKYSLSTPFDMSTAIYSGDSVTLTTQMTFFFGFHLSPDGTKLITGQSSGGFIYEYTLSTPFLLSSAVYSGNSFESTLSDSYALTGIAMSRDGKLLFKSAGNYPGVVVYRLESPYDISTIVFSDVKLSLNGSIAISFSASGEFLLVMDGGTTGSHTVTMHPSNQAIFKGF